ncbi:hypothetical protein [Planktothricoides raciborskii]|uniref:hypothetical protein n=1 Tax=Planktothricoides raciborskii TaxID=132608 RepID=UPI0028BDEF3D|nr:hypothetical protein [Planktothricoides raciborskii]
MKIHCCLLFVVCCLLVVGCWLLVVGCWLIVVGWWLFISYVRVMKSKKNPSFPRRRESRKPLYFIRIATTILLMVDC